MQFSEYISTYLHESVRIKLQSKMKWCNSFDLNYLIISIKTVNKRPHLAILNAGWNKRARPNLRNVNLHNNGSKNLVTLRWWNLRQYLRLWQCILSATSEVGSTCKWQLTGQRLKPLKFQLSINALPTRFQASAAVQLGIRSSGLLCSVGW